MIHLFQLEVRSQSLHLCSCQFLLKPETDNYQIHEFALISPETIIINPVQETTPSKATDTSKVLHASSMFPTVALLRTCRKVCNEANPIFYGMNKFAIYLCKYHLSYYLSTELHHFHLPRLGHQYPPPSHP